MHSPFELCCPDLCSCNPCSILCGHSRGIPAAVTLPSLSKPCWRNLPGRGEGAARQVAKTLESRTHLAAPTLKMAERAEPASAKQICNTCSTCPLEITSMWVSLLVPDRPTRSVPIHCTSNLNFIKVQLSESSDVETTHFSSHLMVKSQHVGYQTVQFLKLGRKKNILTCVRVDTPVVITHG